MMAEIASDSMPGISSVFYCLKSDTVRTNLAIRPLLIKRDMADVLRWVSVWCGG